MGRKRMSDKNVKKPHIPTIYGETILDVKTGETKTRHFTQEEIDAFSNQKEPIPLKIDACQIRLLLVNKRKLADAEKLIQSLGDASKVEWEYKTEFKYIDDNELIKKLAEFCSMEKDDLYIEAGKL
jgi:hypothetical protein